jgi:hypothetical protein
MALDPITAGLDLANTVIGKLFPDKSKEEQAQMAMALTIVQGQIDVNRAEAASSSTFTSGWRPFIGWVCGMGCAWNWIGLPIAIFVCALAGHPVVLERADLGEMLPLLLGMLGLGGFRTYEKVKGAA